MSARPPCARRLRSLEVLGFIQIRKGVSGGAFVTEIHPQKARELFANFLHFKNLSLAHLSEVRSILETHTAAAAARTIGARRSRAPAIPGTGGRGGPGAQGPEPPAPQRDRVPPCHRQRLLQPPVELHPGRRPSPAGGCQRHHTAVLRIFGAGAEGPSRHLQRPGETRPRGSPPGNGPAPRGRRAGSCIAPGAKEDPWPRALGRPGIQGRKGGDRPIRKRCAENGCSVVEATNVTNRRA